MLQLPISHLLITRVPSWHNSSKEFLQNLRNTSFDPEEGAQAEILRAIKITQQDYLPDYSSNFLLEPYINVDYLLSLLIKSRIIEKFDVLYSQTTTSTQRITYDYFEKYSQPLIYVADTQTNGRGRRDNQWESPKGCLLFTFTYEIKPEYLVVIQYLISLSIHEAIIEKNSDKYILKWPNDTYYDDKKVAGNMVQAVDFAVKPLFKKIFIGIGVNVDNEEPTTCINSISERNGKQKIRPEELIASIIEKFEENLYLLETKGWENGLANKYLRYWEDYGIEATLIEDHQLTAQKVRINGIDMMGNLMLEDLNGSIKLLNPNLYSYDAINKVFHLKR